MITPYLAKAFNWLSSPRKRGSSNKWHVIPHKVPERRTAAYAGTTSNDALTRDDRPPRSPRASGDLVIAAQLKDYDTSDRRLCGNDCWPSRLLRRARNDGPGKQSGYLLLPVAVAIALIGVIAFLISSQSAIEVELTAGELDAARAEYVAQAGLQHALRHHSQQGCGPYTDLTAYPFGTDQYDTKLSHDLGGTANYTIAVDQDTWIRNDFPTDTNGGSTKLHTKYDTGKIEHVLLRHDLSAIPAKAAVLSATAWFYLTDAHAEGPVDIHAVSADWVEADATWDSMSDNIDSAVLASIPAQDVANVWVPVNLTAQVQAWVNGETYHGIALSTTSEGSHGQYASRESATQTFLEVDVNLYQPAPSHAQVRVDHGGGKDVVLDSFYNTRNHGDYRLDVDSVGTLEHALIQFDLPAIPPGAKIVSARLELYHTITNGTPVDPGIDIHRVTRDWVEGTQSGGGTADGATWDTWDGSNNWTQGGGDFDITPVASGPVSIAINDWESWDMRELVQGWVDGTYPNYGMALKGSGSTDISFASKEDADPALRPKLSITYACECGQVCSAPRGSGNILMVVVNPTTLVAEDQQAKDLFESWGYTVSVISESANQASYDAAVASNDVVFISETVNSNSVGTKLANAPIGVVSQDRDYNPDLGLATGGTLKVGTDIDIVDTDHFITRPFPAGPLPIYAAGMEQLVTTGALTADQQPLAEIGGDASLVVLDQGAAMEGGGSAAGRRVILPLGTRYRFNWDHLNANGRLLVQRALEWGIGADDKAAGKLLLVVANAGSLLTSESDRMALIESWGYDVTLISDDASQAEYDTALADVDVVYICGSGSSTAVGTKLTAATVGVLSEDIGLVDELGIAEPAFVKKNSQQINVIDNTHYVTNGFVLGSLQLYTYLPEIWTVTGALAPGLNILGETQDAVGTFPPGLAYLETGAELYGGGFAAGRRVQMPWSQGSFDINALNADGRTIFRRAIEWGAGAEIPDLSNELLFVVADASTLTGAETAKKSLIEGWGYTVNLIDDGDSVTNFVAAFAANGVIFVSGEVSDTAVSSKLVKTTLGVVNEQISLHDELLLSTSAATNDFSNILVIDNTHYITDGIATGWHGIASSNQPLNALTGTLAPGMTNLAEVWISGANYDFGLAVVDTGGQLNAGEIAAGRRAQLPWGTASFDFSALNANGQNLMRRAIEWAGGADIDLSPFAHWKLDETSGPTAVDSEGDNDGTWTNGPVAAPGVDAGGLDFDGSNDYVDAGTFDVVGSGITMMAWFNAEAIATDDGRFVSKASSPNEVDAYWQLSTTDSGSNRYLRMRIKAGGTTTTLADSSVNLATGTWYLATGTYDNASGMMRLYLDGVEVASTAHAVGGALDTNPAVSVALGANGTAERFFNGILDDVRIYNRALGANEIQDYYDASAPQAPGYTEVYEPWSALNDSTWEVVDLAPFGVPADVVVEVAVVHADASKEQWGGVRAVGSALERRILLHEPESGGVDSVTMHVQADASGRIEHYTSKKGTTSFVLLGYWTGAAYVELFEPFSAGAANSWVSEGVDDEGLGPNQIAEVLMQNTNGAAERLAGVRAAGSSINRRFDLHEAESGGVDAVTMMVETDAASTIEAYAEDTVDVEFYVLGYWSAPPGSFTELGGSSARSTPTAAWGVKDISSLGVPANSITQFVLSNDAVGTENVMGARAVGSTLDRFVDLQEAEAGGSDLATMHAHVDANTEVEWYSESGISGAFFYPVGAWLLAP